MKEDVQINIPTTKDIKDELMRIARLRSVEKDKTISYIDLIKEEIDRLIELSGSKK